MSREINLRAEFGEPEEVLERFKTSGGLLHPTGIVPGYRFQAYESALKGAGADTTHLNSRYHERRFQLGLAATRLAVNQGGLGLFVVHVPRTRYNETPTRTVFEKACGMSTRENPATGGILSLYIVTQGEAYTHLEDNNGQKYRIEEEDYDGTEEALKEGKSLGALTVLLERENVQEEIHRLIQELKAGQMPTRAVRL